MGFHMEKQIAFLQMTAPHQMFGSATTYPRTRQEVRDKSEVFLFYWRPILVSLSKFWILIFPHIFGHRRCRNGIGAEDIFDS